MRVYSLSGSSVATSSIVTFGVFLNISYDLFANCPVGVVILYVLFVDLTLTH